MKKLWEASKNIKINSNLYKFEKFISKNYNFDPSFNYEKILNWSIKNSSIFWHELWKFFKVKGLEGNKKINRSNKSFNR